MIAKETDVCNIPAVYIVREHEDAKANAARVQIFPSQNRDLYRCVSSSSVFYARTNLIAAETAESVFKCSY